MNHSEKPIILIAHGAWHRPWHYRNLINRLRSKGYTTLVPSLATSGYDDALILNSYPDDVRRLHEVLLPYLSQGRKAVIVAHSYGGVPATHAVETHTVAERAARGLQGGIVSVVYIASLPVIQKGVSLYEAGGNKWLTLHFHDVDEFKLPLKRGPAADAFYNDLEESVKVEAAAALCDQSRRPFEEAIRYTMQDVMVPKTYVICKDDHVVPVQTQRLAALTGRARKMELDCGHSPFLKERELDVLVDVISKAAGGSESRSIL
jgi:pimeloyl-ACP methyl ester carboxylesterase